MRTPTPTDRDDALLEAAVSMDTGAIRADLESVGVSPTVLLQTVRNQVLRLDRALEAQQDVRDERTLEDALSLDIADVRDQLRAAGVDPEAFARRMAGQLPQL